jgi:F-type H+-transporting ATPase subunit delta
MTSSALASRYANALADVVTAPTAGADPQRAAAELRSFGDALAASPALHGALTSPAVPPSRKRAVVGRIADALGLSRIPRNFLLVLVDHRRIAALADVLDRFELLIDERLGFTRAHIRSAREMDERQRALLIAELERLAGKRVRPRFDVDESLIGGAVAKIGSTVYDGSVRTRLEGLGRRLAAE